MEYSDQYVKFRRERISHWDKISKKKENQQRLGGYYHELLCRYYQFHVPSGLHVLELGCGHGAILAALEPAFGVGVDISEEMLKVARQKHPDLLFLRGDALDISFLKKFDIIILSDLVNDLWDVQQLFKNLHALSHGRTRIILNFFNNIWRIPLSIPKKFGLGGEVLEQNWFAPHDVFNLLNLTEFEVVKYTPRIIFPLHVPLFSEFMNKFIVNLPLFNWFGLTNFIIAKPINMDKDVISDPEVSVIVPARNEAGNIEAILKRVPELGRRTEIIFVEGGSTDNTYEVIEGKILSEKYSSLKCRLFRQPGKGKGDAVRLGFEKAEGDILMILDADMTVPPEDLCRFYDALVYGKGEFINGVRLVYPLEEQSMRFLNMIGNKFFSLAFTWLLDQPIKDTLCGTKVLWKGDYYIISENRKNFGDFDPFGDFDLLFGAAKLNLKITEIPIRYRKRIYGDTNIQRWRNGCILLRMLLFAAKKIKFI